MRHVKKHKVLNVIAEDAHCQERVYERKSVR